jgi:HEAT repeat protein
VTRFHVDAREWVPHSLHLERQGAFSLPEVVIPDRDFDDAVFVGGDEPALLAVLDRGTREKVRAALRDWRAFVKHGEIRAELPRLISNATELEEIVRGLVDLAGRLSVHVPEIPNRLAKLATSDDLPAVRLRSLQILRDLSPDLARETSLQAITDSVAEVRLEAALVLGRLDVVAGVAGLETAEARLRVRALRHLLEHRSEEVVDAVLDKLISSREYSAIRAAARGLGPDHRAAAAPLARILPRVDSETAVVLAESLGGIGDASAEPALLSLLERDEPAVQVAAARALGQAGTARAVEPLLDRTRWLLDPKLRRAARGAVSAIQARLGNPERGRLSLARLSTTDGALSVTPKGEGRLSLGESDASGGVSES